MMNTTTGRLRRDGYREQEAQNFLNKLNGELFDGTWPTAGRNSVERLVRSYWKRYPVGERRVNQSVLDCDRRGVGAVGQGAEIADRHQDRGMSIVIVRGSDLKIKPIEWTWPGWLARGKFESLPAVRATANQP